MRMKRIAACVAALMSAVAVPAYVSAQQSASSEVAVAVPRLVNVSGEYHPKDGGSAVPLETLTLRVYSRQTGGVPLWQETQTVAVDAYGFYSVVLGATQKDGIPPDVFASSGAQWLGLTWARDGTVEGPRTRLTSVPYALRAADAETLGGLPASAYQLATNAPRAGANVQPVYSVPMGAIAMPNVNAAPDVAGASTPAAPKALLGGSTNFLAKYYNGSDVGASAIYEINGFTGFNTTTPQDIIHSRFTNGDGTLTGLAVQNLGTSPLSYSGMLFYDQNGQVAQFQGFGNITHEYRINNVASNATINFMTGGVSRFLADSIGHVGINNASPAVTFDVARDGFFADAHFMTYMNSSAGTFVDGGFARGTFAAPLALQAGDLLASHGAWGHMGGSSGFARSASMTFTASEAFTPAARGTDITFYNTASGTTSPTPRMIIHNDGSVGIGTTGPLDKLQVLGDIRVGTGTTNGCIKNFAGTGIVGTCSSDARLKEDIRAFAPVLDRVAALRPVLFKWRADQFPERHYGNDPAYGLIAQEVEAVLPEMVVTQDDGMKAVDYSELPLLAIQAIKELKQRVA